MTQTEMGVSFQAGEATTAAKEPQSATPYLVLRLSIFGAILANLLMGRGTSFGFPSYLNAGRTGDPPVFYLMPAVYAFVIWLPIYAGQTLFGFLALFQSPGCAPAARIAMLKKMGPWWMFLHAFTIAWMLLPNTLTKAVALTITAICLCVAHGAVTDVKEVGCDIFYWVMYVPLTMHFGWVTAASLISWSEVTAELTTSVAINLAELMISLLGAAALGTFLSVRRNSALLAAVIAWATIFVGVMTLNPRGERRQEAFARDFGSVGQPLLGGVQIALGLLMVGVAARVVMQKKSEEVAEQGLHVRPMVSLS